MTAVAVGSCPKCGREVSRGAFYEIPKELQV